MKTLELKPCKCGSKKLFVWDCLYRWFFRYFICCEDCGFCGKSALTKRGAVRKWNRRVTDAVRNA